MSHYTNQDHMEPPPFHVGDCVYVRTDHIHMNRAARKLVKKKISPFLIVLQPSMMSFTLHLPTMICIHPVFHVAQLEPEHPNTFEDHNQPPPPLLIVEGTLEYLIEHILDSKYNHVRHKCQLLYHIKWVGYPISNNLSDWVLANTFDDKARKRLSDTYHEQHLAKPGPKLLAKDWERRQAP